MHYGYDCPICGYNFVLNNSYEVDGVKYPFILNSYSNENGDGWTERHKCPNCKIDVEYDDAI